MYHYFTVCGVKQLSLMFFFWKEKAVTTKICRNKPFEFILWQAGVWNTIDTQRKNSLGRGGARTTDHDAMSCCLACHEFSEPPAYTARPQLRWGLVSAIIWGSPINHCYFCNNNDRVQLLAVVKTVHDKLCHIYLRCCVPSLHLINIFVLLFDLCSLLSPKRRKQRTSPVQTFKEIIQENWRFLRFRVCILLWN